MPTTYAWPTTEEEHVTHLHNHHHVFVGSMAEWRAVFGAMRLPSQVHADMHTYDNRRHNPHRHSEYGTR